MTQDRLELAKALIEGAKESRDHVVYGRIIVPERVIELLVEEIVDLRKQVAGLSERTRGLVRLR